MERTDQEAAEQEVKQGMLLPPGYKPEDPVYTNWELQAKRQSFQPPLTNEELECWQEHRYLQCPISQQTVKDKEAGIGIGIYQMPYALPDSEKERQRANDQKYAQKRAAEAQNIQLAQQAGLDLSETDLRQLTCGPPSVDDLFQVYPIVARPPDGSLANTFWKVLEQQGERAHLGRLKVCIGHYFSKKAYNWGVTGSQGQLFNAENPLIWSLERRGVVNLFQQYNACVLRWAMVKPEAGDGNMIDGNDQAETHYSRKNFNITNRLALYASPDHGKDVLKGLIESQISLLLYNQSNIFRKRPQLLPSATRKALPRILRAVIDEVVSDRNQGLILDEDYLDHVIRTYCWIHQVAIKFIKHHRHIYEHIYRSIIRWVQNPFSPENRRNWPQIEELLVACSLVNIPWAVIREAFVRRLFADLAAGASEMKEEADMTKRMRHMFHQNWKRFQNILMTMSFHLSKPIAELDKQYERCGGLLPRSERENIKKSIREIKKITCLEEFWCTLGMDNPALPKKEIGRHIKAFFEYIVANTGSWSNREVSAQVLNAIQVPPISELTAPNVQSVQQGGILSYRQREAKLKKERQEELWRKHQGMPILPKDGHLNKYRCNYHDCGLEFENRTQLFEHLEEAIPQMIPYYHDKHQGMNLQNFPHPADLKAKFVQAEADGYPHHWSCPACHENFSDFESIRKHLRDTGVGAFFEPGDQLDELLAQEEAERILREEEAEVGAGAGGDQANLNNQDEYDNMETCLVCWTADRGVIFIRCGHLIACAECASKLNECPVCRAQIESRLPVAYRDQAEVTVYQV